MSDHTTSDDATRYRPAAEVEAAQRIEPLIRTRVFLESRGLWNEEAEAALLRRLEQAGFPAERCADERRVIAAG